MTSNCVYRVQSETVPFLFNEHKEKRLKHSDSAIISMEHARKQFLLLYAYLHAIASFTTKSQRYL